MVHRRRVAARATRTHLATLLVLLALLAGAGVLWRQDMVRQRVEQALATNAAVVRAGLASIRTVGAPSYQAVPVRRPELAPLGLVAAGPAPAPDAAAPLAFPRMPQVVADPALPRAPAISTPMQPLPLAAAPVDRSGATAMAPQVIRSVRPAYPPEALANGVQGQVEVEFTLSGTGVPENLEVVRSASRALDAAALKALAHWRFSAPSQTAQSYRQTFTFRLGAESDDGVAANGCVILTGSHICRHALEADPGVRAPQPGH